MKRLSNGTRIVVRSHYNYEIQKVVSFYFFELYNMADGLRHISTILTELELITEELKLHNDRMDAKYGRIDVLPTAQKQQARQRLVHWLETHQTEVDEQIVNTRNPNIARQQIYQDVQSYVNYLDSAKDESDQLPELVRYLKLLESSRKNNILEFIPEYEDILRSAGY